MDEFFPPFGGLKLKPTIAWLYNESSREITRLMRHHNECEEESCSVCADADLLIKAKGEFRLGLEKGKFPRNGALNELQARLSGLKYE